MAKIHWTPKKHEPFANTMAPGTLHDVDFMVKDSKRFADSGGWGGPRGKVWTPTLRDIATLKVSIDSKPYIGTPERVADELAETIGAVGGDGFAIRQGIWPGYVGPFVEQVVPLLQKRGVVRTEYAGTTLRVHLHEF